MFYHRMGSSFSTFGNNKISKLSWAKFSDKKLLQINFFDLAAFFDWLRLVGTTAFYLFNPH